MSYSLVPYDCKVLADSVAPLGTRLTTIEVTYPRFIHAEMLRHRVQSHCVASSRALPPEDVCDQVEEMPFVPATFNARVKGMGVGQVLDEAKAKAARTHWIAASKTAVMYARALIKLDVDKSRINRLLEPFMYVTDVITATEWDNFFALRSPDGDEPTIEFPAQLEFQRCAIEMRRVMQASPQQPLDDGMWHLPKLTADELGKICEMRNRLGEGWVEQDEHDRFIRDWCMISARRVAATSFLKDAMQEDHEISVGKAEALAGSAHFSPFEHVARPLHVDDLHLNGVTIPAKYAHDLWCRRMDADHVVKYASAGNFKGWLQFRHLFPHQDNHYNAIRGNA